MTVSLHKASIAQAIEAIIKTEAELFIKKAVADYEAALRNKIAHVIMCAHDFYSVDRMGQELVIRVQIEKGKDQ